MTLITIPVTELAITACEIFWLIQLIAFYASVQMGACWFASVGQLVEKVLSAYI